MTKTNKIKKLLKEKNCYTSSRAVYSCTPTLQWFSKKFVNNNGSHHGSCPRTDSMAERGGKGRWPLKVISGTNCQPETKQIALCTPVHRATTGVLIEITQCKTIFCS